jgi:opacity protein-like surface antigen
VRNPLIAVSFAIGLVIASSASAQERGVVQGVAGMTFGTETGAIFGGGFGVNVAPSVQITGEFGRMQNILPKWMQDEADEGARLVEDVVFIFFDERVDVDVDARASAFYGMGGARFVAPTAGLVRPFVGGSVGFAHVTPSIGLALEGDDITQEAIDDGFLERFESLSKLMMAFDGGVSVRAGRAVSIDIGYRYTRIFADPRAVGDTPPPPPHRRMEPLHPRHLQRRRANPSNFGARTLAAAVCRCSETPPSSG